MVMQREWQIIMIGFCFMDASTIMCGLSFDKFENGVDLEKVEDNAGGATHDRVKNLEIVKLY